MTTFADSLKSEIARLARKELKGELLALRKSSATYRSEIAELKRRLKSMETQLKALGKATRAGASGNAEDAASTDGARTRQREFKGEQLHKHRTKLGLSQAQMAVLLGASTLSVSKWEGGKAMPRAAQLGRIHEALKLGKRAALAQLEAK